VVLVARSEAFAVRAAHRPRLVNLPKDQLDERIGMLPPTKLDAGEDPIGP
jgi:hypothetical protein